MMHDEIHRLLDALEARGVPASEILVDQDEIRFQQHSKRWSDIGRQIPAAIILPTTEAQILATVRWALASSIPFVPKSGGHSLWSTIDGNGVVIDLSNYSSIDVDATGQTATVRGGILSKQVAVALAKAGLFTALGSGNTVGAIPFLLGGGISPVTSLVGFGSDQILAARIIDARGNIIDVTQHQNTELLYAIRGAGQFFGLITQLTIKAYPLSKLGNADGTFWGGSFMFPMDRAPVVGSAIEQVVNNSEYATSGMVMLTSAPSDRKPVILIGGRCLGTTQEAETAYSPLAKLDPLVKTGTFIPIENSNDQFQFLEAKGGYKRYGTVGLRRFDLQAWLQTVESWQKLIASCPDAVSTSFNFQWDSRPAKGPAFDSAMSLHDIRFWQNNLLWYTDNASTSIVNKFNDESIAIMRGPNRSEYADYQNANRDGPIDLRFRPAGKLQKLRELKARWDPTGVFTDQLLK